MQRFLVSFKIVPNEFRREKKIAEKKVSEGWIRTEKHLVVMDTAGNEMSIYVKLPQC